MKFGVSYRHITTRPNEADPYIWVERESLEELENEIKNAFFPDLDLYEPFVLIFEESGKIISRVKV